MYARIAVYELTSGNPAELVETVRQPGGMLEIFQGSPGFLSYEIADAGGRIVSISRWESAAQADDATQAAASFVKENLADNLALQENHVGELIFSSMS